MPKDVDIRPGQTFHLPAAQEKNVESLLKVLSKKEATEALSEIGKLNNSGWNDIKESVIGLNEFMISGGVSSMGQQIKDVIELQIEAILTPITNEINQIIVDAFNPILEKLSPLINDLSQFIAENKEGALIGAIIGMLLPGGAITAAIGAVVGALIQEFFDDLITLKDFKGADPMGFLVYKELGFYPKKMSPEWWKWFLEYYGYV